MTRVLAALTADDWAGGTIACRRQPARPPLQPVELVPVLLTALFGGTIRWQAEDLAGGSDSVIFALNKSLVELVSYSVADFA